MTRIKAILACVVLLGLTSASCTRYFSRDSAAVAKLAEPVRISLENADSAEPAVAAGPQGTAFVTWVEHRPKKEADVMVAQIDREGKPMGEPVRVNPNAGEATAWRGDAPTLSVAADGTVYVGWAARDATKAHASILYLSASRDGGRSFAPPTKVNDDEKPGEHGMHSLAVSQDGRIHLAWLDERNLKPAAEQHAAGGKKMEQMEQNKEVFTAFSTDGGRSFSKNQRIAGEACPCCKTSVAMGADGRVYIGWRQVLPGEYRHIAIASSADSGATYSNPVIVSDDKWLIAGCPVSGPALSVASDGTLSVMWYTEGERGTTGLYWAESRDQGKTFSERKLFAGGQAFGNPLLLSNEAGKLLAVWGNNDGGTPRLMAAPLATEGKENAPLATSAELPSAALTGDQLFIGYITSANDRRSIWVLRAKPTA
ncbi:MAG TPA: sialidase family protein [Pyrinomonadaceae bacterium]|jgi:hypothetical protein|nr:sialidase family protein [Pyrinomonadaceae bacterium]